MLVAGVLAIIVGFNWGGWVTGGTAVDRAGVKAQDAVLLRLTPDVRGPVQPGPPGKGAKLDELKAIAAGGNPELCRKAGLGHHARREDAHRDVASACSKLLIEG